MNQQNILKVAAGAASQAEYLRLPRDKERDPIFGLSRSYLNTLVIPCRPNNYSPPVRSIVLRKPGSRTGVRLIDIGSLRAYIHSHVEPAYAEQTATHKR